MNYVVLYSGWPAPAFVNNNAQAKRYFFESILPNVKQEIITYLKKGGFIFGEDLYQNIRLVNIKMPLQKIITINVNGKISTKKVITYRNIKWIYIDIYFEDSNNEGCDYLLQRITKTGLLNRDLFVKNKCLTII